jgi:mRNA interferase RelE/StbE
MAARVSRLALDPRPPGSEKLAGASKYRLRQGDYRILYGFDDTAGSVVVIKIGHRCELYR